MRIVNNWILCSTIIVILLLYHTICTSVSVSRAGIHRGVCNISKYVTHSEKSLNLVVLMKIIEIIIVKFRTISITDSAKIAKDSLLTVILTSRTPFSSYSIFRFMVHDLPTISDYLNLSILLCIRVIIPWPGQWQRQWRRWDRRSRWLLSL